MCIYDDRQARVRGGGATRVFADVYARNAMLQIRWRRERADGGTWRRSGTYGSDSGHRHSGGKRGVSVWDPKAKKKGTTAARIMSSVALGCLLDKVRPGGATVTRREAPRTLRVGGTRDSNGSIVIFSSRRLDPEFERRLASCSSRHVKIRGGACRGLKLTRLLERTDKRAVDVDGQGPPVYGHVRPFQGAPE